MYHIYQYSIVLFLHPIFENVFMSIVHNYLVTILKLSENHQKKWGESFIQDLLRYEFRKDEQPRCSNLIYNCYLHLQSVSSEDVHSEFLVEFVVLLLVQSNGRCFKNDSKPLCNFLSSIGPFSATLYQFVLFPYLHCSYNPGITGVLLGAGSWSMGAEGIAVCAIATVREPGCSKVITGTPVAPAALNPTFPCIPSCTALCISHCLLFLDLRLQ